MKQNVDPVTLSSTKEEVRRESTWLKTKSEAVAMQLPPSASTKKKLSCKNFARIFSMRSKFWKTIQQDLSIKGMQRI